MDQRVWHSDPTFPVYPNLNHEESGDNRLVDLSEDSYSRPFSQEDESSTSSSIENILGTVVDDVPRRSSVRFTGVSTSNGSFRGTPPNLLNSSRLDRLSSYGSKSAPRLELCGKSGGKQQFNMIPTRQYAETLDKLEKEVYDLKLKLACQQQKWDAQEKFIDDYVDEIFPQNRQEDMKHLIRSRLEVRSLREEIQDLQKQLAANSNETLRDAPSASRPSSSKLSDTFHSESTAASPAKRSSQNHVVVNGTSAFGHKKTESPIPHGLTSADSDATFEEWKDELDATPTKVSGSSPVAVQQCETATQSSFVAFDMTEKLEEARLTGYGQALEEIRFKEEAVERPIVTESATNTEVAEDIQPSSTPDLALDVTEYRGFPAARMGAASAMSPFKRTALAGSERETMSSPKAFLATSTPFIRPGQQRMSNMERKTFNMLIQRLKELVEFLTHGLSGSFNTSETTLNLSNNATFFEANLDISLIPDIGSGDGSHVSFSLATKLQEIIDISKELSLHDVEVETDQHWVSLQEERTSLVEQVEALTKALSAASEAARTAEAEVQRLEVVTKSSEEDFHKQIFEMESNTEALRSALTSSRDSNAHLEEELAELLEKIPVLERQMAEHQEQQMLIMEHAARRPDCDASIGTDILMDDLEEDLRASVRLNENLNEQIDLLKNQLGSVESTKEYLKSRLDELEGVLSQLEDSVAVKEGLERQITILEDRCAKSNQDFDMLKDLHDKAKASLKAITAEKMCLEQELNGVRWQKESEVQELTSKISQLDSNLQETQDARHSIQEELQTASEDIKALVQQLREKEAALTEQRKACVRLEAFTNRERRSAVQQTDETWTNVKAEQTQMIGKLAELIDQVEFLESNLKTLKAANESEVRSKEQVTISLGLTVNRLTEEAERLLGTNEALENEVNALRGTLTATEEQLREEILRRQRWEKAVHKQIGKTQLVLGKATQQVVAHNGRVNKGVLNPLSENRRPE